MSDDIFEKEKELVIFRLSKMPLTKKISIGSEGQFDRDELIKHVENEDAVGKKIVEIQMSFLRAMKSGKLYA